MSTLSWVTSSDTIFNIVSPAVGPVPAVAPGAERQRAVARVVASVSVPVLFLGGPITAGGRAQVLDEVRDVMEGGGAGMAMGRTIYQDPDPAEVAGLVQALVHGR